jgi:GntR family transcriptional regulator/MocR family aminotransferase
LIDAATRELTGLLTVRPAAAGMHLLATLADGIDDQAASQRAAAHQLVAPPLSLYSITPYHHKALLLGYTAMSKQEIDEGVRHLATALSQESIERRGTPLP